MQPQPPLDKETIALRRESRQLGDELAEALLQDLTDKGTLHFFSIAASVETTSDVSIVLQLAFNRGYRFAYREIVQRQAAARREALPPSYVVSYRPSPGDLCARCGEGTPIAALHCPVGGGQKWITYICWQCIRPDEL